MRIKKIQMATKYLIFSENIFPDWEIDEKKFINIAKKLLKYYLSKPDVFEKSALYGHDFDKISSHIEKTTGVKPEIFRFPGGSINYFNASLYRQISGEMIRRGYVYYDWNISAEDAVRAGVSAADITRYALSGDSSMQKKIVLMHDGPGHRNTAEALPGIIEGLAKQGYKFAPLTKEVMPVVFS